MFYRRRCRGSRRSLAPPPSPLKNTFTFDTTCDIGNFRAHIAFSDLRRLKNFLRSSEARPPEQPPTDAFHKSITDALDTVKIALANIKRKGYFGKFEYGYVNG